MKTIRLCFVLLLLAAFGCSKKEAVTNLGVIELAPNTPKHLNIDGVNCTITETLRPNSTPVITAKSEWKVTQEDIAASAVPPGTKVGATIKTTVDLSNLRTDVETIGFLGGKMVRYTLKYHAD